MKTPQLKQFIDLLLEGVTYEFNMFGVGKSPPQWRTTNHTFCLTYRDDTTVVSVPETTIPRFKFNFVPYDELNSSNFDRTRLIGEMFIIYHAQLHILYLDLNLLFYL